METDIQKSRDQMLAHKLSAFAKSHFNFSQILQFAAFLFGCGILAFFIYFTGLETIKQAVENLGWGIVIIIALNGSRHLLRAFSVFLAIPPLHRSIKFRNMVGARLAGDAVSILGFTGPLLGEATKAAILKRWMPLSQSVAAVVIDNIIYNISVVFMICSGAGLLFYTHTVNNSSVIFGVLGVILFSLISISGFIVLLNYRVKPFSWVLAKYRNHKSFPKFIIKKEEKINELENNGYSFYFERRSSFFAIVAVNLFAHLLSVSEVYIALYLIGFEASIIDAFIIESLTKVINLVFGFVPGTIGVYEGGNGVILQTIGFATATGVVLGLVRKGAIVFWTVVGVMILLWNGTPGKKQALHKDALEFDLQP